MNERIQELWDKAEHSVNEVFVWDPTGPDREDVIREKFAELIVKECARVAMNTNLEDVEGGDSDVLYAAHTQIKQHFGVEE